MELDRTLYMMRSSGHASTASYLIGNAEVSVKHTKIRTKTSSENNTNQALSVDSIHRRVSEYLGEPPT
jgi:hypothetical protein